VPESKMSDRRRRHGVSKTKAYHLRFVTRVCSDWLMLANLTIDDRKNIRSAIAARTSTDGWVAKVE
jgi:hypothetical protein